MTISSPSVSLSPRPFLSDSRLHNRAQEVNSKEMNPSKSEMLKVRSLFPFFTSRSHLNSSSSKQSFLPFLEMNEALIVQAQTPSLSGRNVCYLIVHSFSHAASFKILLENMSVLNSVKIAMFANKILIHSDNKYLRLLNLDRSNFSLLAADLDERSNLLISDNASFVVATLNDNTLKTWKLTRCGQGYIGSNFFEQYDLLNNLCFNHDQSCLLFTYKKDAQYFLGILDLRCEDLLRRVRSILIGSKNISFVQASLKSAKVLIGHDDESACFVDLEDNQIIRNQRCFQDNFISPSLQYSVGLKEIFDGVNKKTYPIHIPECVGNSEFNGIGFSLITDSFFMILGDFLVRFNLKDGKCFEVCDLTVKADLFAFTRSEACLAGVRENGSVAAWRLK